MSSIVIELQSEALNSTVPTTDLLRKAYVVARKLHDRDFEQWIKRELEGYGGTPQSEMPIYREMKGSPEVWNPYHGWQPIMFESPKMAESLSFRFNSQSISEIEHLSEKIKSGGRLEIKYPTEVENDVMNAIGHQLRPTLIVPSSAVIKILDSVRNIILQWALKLEEDGIVGEGLSFSKKEIETAEKASYTINYFAGNVTHSQVQQGSTSSIQKKKT